MDKEASESSRTPETPIRFAAVILRPVQAPVPLAAHQRRRGLPHALERHVNHVETKRRREGFAGQVMGAADAGGAVIHLARVGLDVGDEFAERIGGDAWMDGDKQWRLAER